MDNWRYCKLYASSVTEEAPVVLWAAGVGAGIQLSIGLVESQAILRLPLSQSFRYATQAMLPHTDSTRYLLVRREFAAAADQGASASIRRALQMSGRFRRIATSMVAGVAVLQIVLNTHEKMNEFKQQVREGNAPLDALPTSGNAVVLKLMTSNQLMQHLRQPGVKDAVVPVLVDLPTDSRDLLSTYRSNPTEKRQLEHILQTATRGYLKPCYLSLAAAGLAPEMIERIGKRTLVVEAVSIADDINDAILGFPFSTDRQFSVAAENIVQSLRDRAEHPAAVSIVVDRGLNQVRLHGAQPTVQRSSLQYSVAATDLSHVSIDSRIALLCHLLYWMSENTVQVTETSENSTDSNGNSNSNSGSSSSNGDSPYSWKSLVKGVTERRLVATTSEPRVAPMQGERPASVPNRPEEQLALFETIDQLDSAVEGLGGWIRHLAMSAVNVVADTYDKLGNSAVAVSRGVAHFFTHWCNPGWLFGRGARPTVHTLYIDAADTAVYFALQKMLEHSDWNVQPYSPTTVASATGRSLVVVIGANDADTARRIKQQHRSEQIPVCGILLRSAQAVDPAPAAHVHYIAVQTVHDQLTSFLRERITDGVAVPVVFEELANNIEAIFGAHKVTPTAAQTVLTEYAGSRVMRKGVGRGGAGLLQLIMH